MQEMEREMERERAGQRERSKERWRGKERQQIRDGDRKKERETTALNEGWMSHLAPGWVQTGQGREQPRGRCQLQKQPPATQYSYQYCPV